MGDHQNEKIDLNGNVKHAKKFHSVFGKVTYISEYHS
jgi:hypothetical protein